MRGKDLIRIIMIIKEKLKIFTRVALITFIVSCNNRESDKPVRPANAYSLNEAMNVFIYAIQNAHVDTFLTLVPSTVCIDMNTRTVSLSPVKPGTEVVTGISSFNKIDYCFDREQISDSKNFAAYGLLFKEFSGIEWDKSLGANDKWYPVDKGSVRSLAVGVIDMNLNSWTKIDSLTFQFPLTPGKDTVTIEWQQKGSGFIIKSIDGLVSN
jgi:hypothetical protein